MTYISLRWSDLMLVSAKISEIYLKLEFKNQNWILSIFIDDNTVLILPWRESCILFLLLTRISIAVNKQGTTWNIRWAVCGLNIGRRAAVDKFGLTGSIH